MTLTPAVLQQFKDDEAQHGLEIALYNYTFLIATGILHDLGAKTVTTTQKRKR